MHTVVITGCSGSGKTSLVDLLVSLYPDNYNKVTGWTTREPRPGETEGNPYEFLSRVAFESIPTSGFFSRVSYNGNLYGTHYSKFCFTRVNLVVLELEGALEKQAEGYPVVYIDRPHWESALKARATADTQWRLERATIERELAGHVPLWLTNDGTLEGLALRAHDLMVQWGVTAYTD